ncbi:MAG: PKD domain-containing protein [Chitinophagales bacterium]
MKKIVLLLLSFAIVQLTFPAVGKKQVRLVITDVSSAISDLTDVYLDLGISSDFVNAEDGQKVIDTFNNTPLIYSLSTDNVPCFSNSYGNFIKPVAIPLGTRFPSIGQYRISASILDNFDPTSIVTLEDKQTGIFTDLRLNILTLQIDSSHLTNNRFILHVSYPATLNITKSGCLNNNGSIHIVQDTSIIWNTCLLYDHDMNVVSTLNNITDSFSFSSLPEDYYFVVFIYGQYVATKETFLDGDYVSVSVAASDLNVAVGETVFFSSTTTNTTNFFWTFGDSTVITGVANPEISYSTPGTYVVTVIASNAFGCTAQDQVTIKVYAPSTIQNTVADIETVSVTEKNISLKMKSAPTERTSVELYSLSGALITAMPLQSTLTVINAIAQPAGVYVLVVKNVSGLSTRKIVLQ